MLSYLQGMGCSELGKNTIFKKHPVCIFNPLDLQVGVHVILDHPLDLHLCIHDIFDHHFDLHVGIHDILDHPLDLVLVLLQTLQPVEHQVVLPT